MENQIMVLRLRQGSVQTAQHPHRRSRPLMCPRNTANKEVVAAAKPHERDKATSKEDHDRGGTECTCRPNYIISRESYANTMTKLFLNVKMLNSDFLFAEGIIQNCLRGTTDNDQ